MVQLTTSFLLINGTGLFVYKSLHFVCIHLVQIDRISGNMPEKINDMLNNYANLISAFSLLVSVATLLTTLRFKRRLRIIFEKDDFSKRKERLLKEISGYADSLSVDGIYTDAFLENIDLRLSELNTSYTFLPVRLRFSIRYTCFLINHYCINDFKNGTTIYKHRLCKRLRTIAALLRKEDK